jgi:hypothetical protein
MSCSEIVSAISWAKQTTPNVAEFPVTAFLTRHAGSLSDPNDSEFTGRDFCQYAVGPVHYVGPPPGQIGVVGHLAGDLNLYSNGVVSNTALAMALRQGWTVAVEIFPDGSVTFEEKHNGIGNGFETKVTTTCIGGVLLSGLNQNEVVVVGLRRDPSVDRTPPK